METNQGFDCEDPFHHQKQIIISIMTYRLRNRDNTRMINYGSTSSSSSGEDYARDPNYTRPLRIGAASNTNAAPMASRRGRGRPPAAGRGSRSLERQGRRRRRTKSTSCSLFKKGTVFSWLIALKIVRENDQVWYMHTDQKTKLGGGSITHDGIKCQCCESNMDMWEFEAHVGMESRKPSLHISVDQRRASLLECQIEAWNSDEEVGRRSHNEIDQQQLENAGDRSDDACMICADGGNMICCENCPSTYHRNCLGIQDIPQGVWNCPCCTCVYCAKSEEKHIHDCTLCDKRYHWDCLIKAQKIDLNIFQDNSFCGTECRNIHEELQKMVGRRFSTTRQGLYYNVLKVRELSNDMALDDRHNIMVNNYKLAIAWQVLNSCFETNQDRRTGIDILQSVAYSRWSNMRRLNFSGFYVVALEMGEEIVSVAALRLHGKRVAEMPFTGTIEAHRGEGMCQMLQTCIEEHLSKLHVENLIIPAMSSCVDMWVKKFSFTPLDDEATKELRHLKTLMFSNTVRLQKSLIRRMA